MKNILDVLLDMNNSMVVPLAALCSEMKRTILMLEKKKLLKLNKLMNPQQEVP